MPCGLSLIGTLCVISPSGTCMCSHRLSSKAYKIGLCGRRHAQLIRRVDHSICFHFEKQIEQAMKAIDDIPMKRNVQQGTQCLRKSRCWHVYMASRLPQTADQRLQFLGPVLHQAVRRRKPPLRLELQDRNKSAFHNWRQALECPFRFLRSKKYN